MNHDDIEKSLHLLRHEGLPTPPDAFEQGVWREIRHRRALIGSPRSFPSFFDWSDGIRPLLPQLAAASLILAIGTAWVMTSISPSGQDSVRGTTAVLDLGIFSPDAQELSLTHLTARR